MSSFPHQGHLYGARATPAKQSWGASSRAAHAWNQPSHEASLNLTGEDEFIKILHDRNVVMSKKEARVLFLEVDKNGDGVLGGGELRELSNRIQKPSKSTERQSNRVFLGGSCNPTTWRKDVAIPLLEQNNVTYYNPQVDEWYPELVELERKAKDTATILLFVIDDQTRAVVSMLEVAEFIGHGRHMVLTTQNIKPGTTIAGSTLEQDEIDSLNEARQLVSDLARKSHLESFSSVKAAVLYIGSLFDPLVPRSKRSSVYTPHKISVNQIEDSHIFDTFIDNDGALDPQTAILVFNYLGFHPSDREIKKLFEILDRNRDNKIDFEEFSTFLIYLAELQDLKSPLRKLNSTLALNSILSNIQSYDSSNLMNRVMQSSKMGSFVYLGGSFSGNNWRKDIAIPTLLSAKVSFYNPQIGRDFPNFTCIEWSGREKCSVFLFVISSDARCIKELAEAAYYIGLGRKVVLVINDVKEGARFGSKPVGTPELKDLNRGRAYLRESASVASVPVFDDVASAIQHIVQMAKK